MISHAAFYMVLRRMRGPFLAVVGTYAFGAVVLIAVPGETPDGEAWRMGFLDALYFLTYTAPTIGFGEIPYPYTDAQRLIYMLAIYPPVIAWFYAIVTIFGLMQDPVFKETVAEGRFRRQVRRLADPFWIVCGYGDTGAILIRSLTERGLEATVIDPDPERIADLSTRDLRMFVPGWTADANRAETLSAAGLEHPLCEGVIAATGDDHTNLQVAITVKLLRPELRVLARAESRETADNMYSFGTDHVVDPFHGFADRLALAITSPEMHRVYEWLSGMPNTPLVERPQPPRGRWLICGYGRFGKAVARQFDRIGLSYNVIDQTPERSGAPEGTIYGKGTEAKTLREASVENADAVLAATGDDADNLSIIMTARDIAPNLFLAARENQMAHKPLFKAAKLQLPVEPSYIIATRMLSLVTAPLLPEFLRIARGYGRSWHAALTERIRAVSDGRVPEIWTLTVSAEGAPAVAAVQEEGLSVDVHHLVVDPRGSSDDMKVLPLLLVRDAGVVPLPDESVTLELGDRLLLCGTTDARNQLDWSLHHRNTLRFLVSGEQRPDGTVWRWLDSGRD